MLAKMTHHKKMTFGCIWLTLDKKRAMICSNFLMAGVAGIEPASTVLETDALPLNHTPTKYGDLYGIRTRECMRERHVS